MNGVFCERSRLWWIALGGVLSVMACGPGVSPGERPVRPHEPAEPPLLITPRSRSGAGSRSWLASFKIMLPIRS